MSVEESTSSDLNNIIVTASSKWISLNVGGKVFNTTLGTLLKEPGSMLARMFSEGQIQSNVDEHGAYLVDRSFQYFEPIINYLRHGQLIYDSYLNPEGILEEAKFFGIESLIPQLETIVKMENNSEVMPLTRQIVINALIQSSTMTELRFQGVNLAGADLRKLDLRYINFKYSCMSRCNLSNANLSNCNLERCGEFVLYCFLRILRRKALVWQVQEPFKSVFSFNLRFILCQFGGSTTPNRQGSMR